MTAGILVACGSDSGSAEPEPPADTTAHSQTLRGEVVEVTTLPDGSGRLTVRRPDNSEVLVEIPERLASTVRIQLGDRIVVEERHMASDGERLQVRNLHIERGQ